MTAFHSAHFIRILIVMIHIFFTNFIEILIVKNHNKNINTKNLVPFEFGVNKEISWASII